MTRQIGDDVWRELDVSAARLRASTRSRLILVIATLTALVIAGVQLHVSGAITPRVEVPAGWGGWFEDAGQPDPLVNRYNRGWRGLPRTTHVSQEIYLVNRSRYTLRLVGVDTDQRGMHVERAIAGGRYVGRQVSIDDPYLLHPDEIVSIHLFYDITDCAAVTSLPQPIPLRFQRWSGQQVIPVTPWPMRHLPDGSVSLTTRDDPEAVQWQRVLADHVCP